MTVCPKCKGKAEYFKEVYNDGKRRREILIKCNKCNGTGEVPMTNEEWLHTLPIEEMADEIISHIAHEIGLARYYNDDDVKEFVEWLKEIHHEM